MTAVVVRDGQIFVGDEEVCLISGEIHYWRVDSDNWPAVLDAIKALGINTIATYVPWHHHEISENSFDFSGKTRSSRDLESFLELVGNKGLWLLIRPGPYIYAEWLNAGVPDRVIQFNKLHSSFKRAAKSYVEAVCKVLHPFLASNDGPIVALQADNNIECWDELYEQQLGLCGGIGLFQEFLQERYGAVADLNLAWETEYKKFDDAKGFSALLDHKPAMMRRYLDTQRFRWWYSNQYAGWIKQCYLDSGIDVPIYFNGFKSLNKEQSLADLAEIGAFAGINVYPTNEFGESDHEHRHTLEDLRYVRVYNKIPYIAELQAGNCHGFHYSRGLAGPNHYRLLTLSAILAGITSWTWFMIAERDIWYGSPITEWGHKALELFETFKQLTSISKTLELPKTTKLVNSSVVLKDLHYVCQDFRTDDTVLSAFYNAGIEYDFYDPGRDAIINPIMFYAGSNWLAEVEQRKLLKYVENGGNLVIFQTHPNMSDEFVEMNLLGISQPDHVMSKMFVDHFDTDIVFLINGKTLRVQRPSPLFIYDPKEGEEPIIGSRSPSEVYEDSSGEWSAKMSNLACHHEICIGYTKLIGKGKIMVLGVKPNASMIISIHEYFNIPIPARSETPGKRGQHSF